MRSNKYRFFRHLETDHLRRELKKAVERRGLKGRELGRVLQYDPCNLYKILRGDRPVPIERIPQFAKGLDIRPEFLIDAYVKDIRQGMYKYFEELEKIQNNGE